jgi:hypothetical protein
MNMMIAVSITDVHERLKGNFACDTGILCMK